MNINKWRLLPLYKTNFPSQVFFFNSQHPWQTESSGSGLELSGGGCAVSLSSSVTV